MTPRRDAELARHLVGRLGGRYSLELGIDVDRGGAEVERWALAATLFGNRISSETAVRTYRTLAAAGIRTIADAGERSRDELVALLDAGGYIRYDERTADRLLQLATALRRSAGVAATGRQLHQTEELSEALDALPGWGPVTVRLFLRELRGVWEGAQPSLDERVIAAAEHLRIAADLRGLGKLAVAADVDLRDLETALVRLAHAHGRGFTRCPGGSHCHALKSSSEDPTVPDRSDC